MDVMHSCPCCLRCPPDKHLTTPYTHLGVTEIYIDMFKECFDIQLVLGNNGSSGICSACVGRLRDASDFKLQVQRCQEELQGMLLVQVELVIKPELAGENADDETASHTLHDNPLIKTETGVMSDDLPKTVELRPVKVEATSDEDCGSVVSLGCAQGQLATSSAVLERRRGDVTAHTRDIPYTCEDCHKRFENEYILRKHIQDTHLSTGPKEIASNVCSSTSETKMLLLDNGKSEFANLMCAECDYTTVCKNNLDAHVKTHAVANKSNCSSSEKHIKPEKNIKDQEITDIGKPPYKCSHCDYRCSKKSNLQNHEMTHTGEKPFECNHCDYKCSRRSFLRRHEMIHTGDKPIKCTKCEYRCKLNEELQRHQLIHTGEKTFQCNHCDYKSSRKANLRTHELVHTKEKPFKCSYCDYSCRRKEHLQLHQRIHSGEKPYKCSHCDFKCIDGSSLRKHKMTHTGEKPIQCNDCDYKCINKSALQKHQMTHTGAKPFECSNCDYKCRRKDQLRKHQMTHTGEKPYKCSHCDYKSIAKGNLQIHQRMHTGLKPFICSHCNHTWRSQQALQKHIGRQHSEQNI